MDATAQITLEKANQEKRQQAMQRAANPYAQGTRYYDLYENNPYAPDKFTRRETIWDKMANAFGMRSGYEAALDEWTKAGSEYDAQIAQLKGEDEYNTPEAQAARMRAAGQNPDLLGTEGVAQAGEFAQEQTSPDINRSSEQVDKVLGAISSIPQAVTFAMGMAEKGMHLMQTLYDTKGKKAGWAKKLEEMAGSFIDEFLDTDLPTEDNNKNYTNYLDTVEKLGQKAEVWAKQNGFTKKEQTKFKNNVMNLARGGRKEEIYKKFTGMHKARKEFGEIYGSKYTPKSDEESEILGIVGELVNKWDSALLHQAGKEEEKAITEENYWTVKSGSQQAAGENAESREKAGHERLVASARRAMNEALRELKKHTKDGNILALGLESTLAILQLKYLE